MVNVMSEQVKSPSRKEMEILLHFVSFSYLQFHLHLIQAYLKDSDYQVGNRHNSSPTLEVGVFLLEKDKNFYIFSFYIELLFPLPTNLKKTEPRKDNK